MKALIMCLGLMCCMKGLSAGAVTLINDSAFPLFAEIIAADGSQLGSESVGPRQTKKWSGGWAGSKVSQTPYTVRWFCEKTGQEFSLCSNVPSGMTVSALACEGEKYCKPPPKKQNDPQQQGSGSS